MSPINFDQPGADCGAGFTEEHHSRPIPFRVRIDPAVCMDHDDMMANIVEAQRRRDDDRDGRRKRPAKRRKDPRAGYYDRYGNFHPARPQRGPHRAGSSQGDRPAPRYDGYGGRPVDQGDFYDSQQIRYRGEKRTSDDKSGSFWATMKTTAVGIGGIAALGGGGFIALTGVMNMVHSAGRSPSFL